MGEITLTGPQAGEALDYALVGNLSALAVGRARYTMICDADGGVLDDLIVYRLGDEEYMVVANASNAQVVAGRAAPSAAPGLRRRGARRPVDALRADRRPGPEAAGHPGAS